MNTRTMMVTVLLSGSAACAQSLMLPPEQTIASLPTEPTENPIYQVSTFAVPPPKPRDFKTHDLVTIVVDETSRQEADQSLKTDKKTNADATLGTIVDPWELLELRLRAGNTQNLKLLDLESNNKFDGKGNYSRSDRLTMKIQATVLDVNPNGILVLEARKYIDKNGETQETVLSGYCRREDVTASNTIFSSQLADLSLTTKNTGSVDQSGRKGIITRVIETLFAF